jgi:predicted component of type VI protein secretion system
MSLNVTLVVVGGDVKTPEVKLRLPSTVGRGRDCSIMLRHPLVSRQHCEIYESSGALMVRDLGSLNGTFVNNQRIEGDAPLQPGQLLTIGTVTFRAIYDEASADGQAPQGPGPQMKSAAKPSDSDGTFATGIPEATLEEEAEELTLPEEPVEVSFDLDDAKPLFTDVSSEKTREASTKRSADTIPAPPKSKPAESKVPDAKPAAEKPAADKPAAQETPAFGFLEAEEETTKEEDDDGLDDFLKNLK